MSTAPSPATKYAAAGFDEAIFLNENGHVAEGATCNIFMVRKGKLITPLMTDNVLEGITRDSIMELAHRELGLQVVERPIDRSELYVCDELFLTGTAVGIAPIVRVDHRPVGDGAIGPVALSVDSSPTSMQPEVICRPTGSGLFRFIASSSRTQNQSDWRRQVSLESEPLSSSRQWPGSGKEERRC